MNPKKLKQIKDQDIEAGIRQGLMEKEIEKHLNRWKEDIVFCFIPKCSCCGKIATTQTTKGKYAQKNNHRPINWGYFCKKCYKKGLEIEEEAMYS